jgi:hypothetical protein
MSTENLEEDSNATPTVPDLSLDPSIQETDSAVLDSQLQTVDQEIPGLSAERSLAENNISKVKLCGVCNEKVYKYKCTRCYLP